MSTWPSSLRLSSIPWSANINMPNPFWKVINSCWVRSTYFRLNRIQKNQLNFSALICYLINKVMPTFVKFLSGKCQRAWSQRACLSMEASLLPFVGIHGLVTGCSWLTANAWFLGELLWHDISTQKSVNIENRIHCILYNAFYFRCSHITELTWWARPPISVFDDGNCSFKCLKLLTHTVLPYVINIWGLIEKNSLTVCKVSNELLSAFFDFRFFRRRHFGMQELGWN